MLGLNYVMLSLNYVMLSLNYVMLSLSKHGICAPHLLNGVLRQAQDDTLTVKDDTFE